MSTLSAEGSDQLVYQLSLVLSDTCDSGFLNCHVDLLRTLAERQGVSLADLGITETDLEELREAAYRRTIAQHLTLWRSVGSDPSYVNCTITLKRLLRESGLDMASFAFTEAEASILAERTPRTL